MPGNLYIVSTPIGNLDDLTVRAIRVLGDVDIIFAESVERTQKLLSHYDIKKKAYSFNKSGSFWYFFLSNIFSKIMIALE